MSAGRRVKYDDDGSPERIVWVLKASSKGSAVSELDTASDSVCICSSTRIARAGCVGFRLWNTFRAQFTVLDITSTRISSEDFTSWSLSLGEVHLDCTSLEAPRGWPFVCVIGTLLGVAVVVIIEFFETDVCIVRVLWERYVVRVSVKGLDSRIWRVRIVAQVSWIKDMRRQRAQHKKADLGWLFVYPQRQSGSMDNLRAKMRYGLPLSLDEWKLLLNAKCQKIRKAFSEKFTMMLMPWFNQLSSSWSSSWESARCTTRASMNNQVAWKYFSLSISRHRCSGASRSSFMWAESTCNVCKCESEIWIWSNAMSLNRLVLTFLAYIRSTIFPGWLLPRRNSIFSFLECLLNTPCGLWHGNYGRWGL